MSDFQPAPRTGETALQFECPAHSDDRAPPPPAIAVIEPRRLYRECLAVLLSRAFPNHAIEARDRVDDLSARQKLVILLCFDRHAIQSPLTLKRKIGLAQSLWAGVPLAIVVDELERNASLALARIGFADMVETSSCASSVVEMVRAMLRHARRDLNLAPPLEGLEGRQAHKGVHLGGPADASESLSSRHITARENDIMRLLRAGDQNKTIAFRLGISESTVKVHLRHLMLKFNAHNRTQLAIGANGLAPTDCAHDLADVDSSLFPRSLAASWRAS